MKIKTCGKTTLLTVSLALCSGYAWAAATASDSAVNYAPSSWGSFSPPNEGTGFGNWSISGGGGGSYGTYLDQASYNDGDGVVDSGYGWGTYANGASSAYIDLTRPFTTDGNGNTSLVNNLFSVGIGSDGIGNAGQSMGINIGSAFSLEYAGGDGDNMSLSVDGGSYNPLTGVNYADLNGGLLVSLEVTGPANSMNESYELTIQPFAGGTPYYTTMGTFDSADYNTASFTFWDDNTSNNQYFNDLNIVAVPEPSTWAILGMSGLSGLMLFRRRK